MEVLTIGEAIKYLESKGVPELYDEGYYYLEVLNDLAEYELLTKKNIDFTLEFIDLHFKKEEENDKR